MSQSHLQRARLLLDKSRYDLAERELRQALIDDPNDYEPYTLLAICLSHGPRERLEEAEELGRRAIALVPDHPFVHANLARVLVLAHKLKEARESAEEAVRLDPNEPWHYAILAMIFCHGQRWKEAAVVAEEGLRLDPEHQECLNFRSAALTHLGRGEEANAAIDEALRNNPMNPTAHANRGWALLQQRKYKESLEHFREALRIDAEHEAARAGMVEALKARNPIYRVLLAYMFWMLSLSDRARFGILIGAYVVYRLLDYVADQYPQAAPYIRPVLYVYIAFALLTWLGRPLFDSLLRLSKYGRFALTPRDRLTSNWFLAIAGATITCVVVYFATESDFAFLLALMLPLLLLPVCALCRVTDRKAKRTLVGVIAAMVLIICVTLAFAWMDDGERTLLSLQVYAYGFVAFSIFGSMASARRPKM